jgi:glycosyltransferase involved in cell wall biosynthesis
MTAEVGLSMAEVHHQSLLIPDQTGEGAEDPTVSTMESGGVAREGPRIDDLTLVIPCRDEQSSIGRVVREWWEARPTNAVTDVLVIDDASSDQSPQILSELQKSIPIRVIRNPRPLGYGESLKLGIRNVRASWVAFTDGDGQYDASDLPVLLSQLRAGYDMAIGVRTPREDPFLRKVISYGFRLLVSVFFVPRARDPTAALRAGRTEVVRTISEQTRYMKGAFLNEFMVRLDRSGFRYSEVPIRHRRRQFGESKNVPNRLLPKVSVQLVVALLRMWREFHRLGGGSPSPQHLPTEGP